MDNTIKLIQIMSSRQQGGAEHFFERLFKAFYNQPAIQQHGILRHQSPYLASLSHNSPISTYNFSQSWNLFIRRQIQQAIQRIDPDIILTWMNRPTKLIGALRRYKTYTHIARLGGFYDLTHYQHCDHLIANTMGIADYLLKAGISSHKIHMISNFIEEIPGTPIKRPDIPLVVAVGRLHENKAFDTLIHAMKHVAETALWIIGDGPEKAALQSLIDSLNLNHRVTLLGWKDKPQNYLATADLFVCPSRHEPLGNVILEAWYQQIPVLATKTHGALELISDGENGMLCDIDNPLDMGHRIQALLNDPMRQGLSEHGLATYQKKFSEKIIVQQYIDLFNAVIGHA